MKYGWLLPALVMLAIACASGGEKKSNTADDWGDKSDGEEVEIDPNAGAGLPPAEGAPQECVDEQGEQIQCESDEECKSCQGNFYCGLDPQGSTRQKVCIFGG